MHALRVVPEPLPRRPRRRRTRRRRTAAPPSASDTDTDNLRATPGRMARAYAEAVLAAPVRPDHVPQRRRL